MLSTRAPFQAATASRTAARGASVVVQARSSKAADFRGLDNAEILHKVDELKREKLRLQYMQRTRGNMLNPGSVSDVKRGTRGTSCCAAAATAAVVAAAVLSSGVRLLHRCFCDLIVYHPDAQSKNLVGCCRRTTQMQCRCSHMSLAMPASKLHSC